MKEAIINEGTSKKKYTINYDFDNTVMYGTIEYPAKVNDLMVSNIFNANLFRGRLMIYLEYSELPTYVVNKIVSIYKKQVKVKPGEISVLKLKFVY